MKKLFLGFFTLVFLAGCDLSYMDKKKSVTAHLDIKHGKSFKVVSGDGFDNSSSDPEIREAHEIFKKADIKFERIKAPSDNVVLFSLKEKDGEDFEFPVILQDNRVGSAYHLYKWNKQAFNKFSSSDLITAKHLFNVWVTSREYAEDNYDDSISKSLHFTISVLDKDFLETNIKTEVFKTMQALYKKFDKYDKKSFYFTIKVFEDGTPEDIFNSSTKLITGENEKKYITGYYEINHNNFHAVESIHYLIRYKKTY